MNNQELLKAANVLDYLYSHSSIFSILQLPISHPEIRSNLDPNFSLLQIETELFKSSYTSYVDFCNKLSCLIIRWIKGEVHKHEIAICKADRMREHRAEMLMEARRLISQLFDRNLHGLKIHELQRSLLNFTWPEESPRWLLKIQFIHSSFTYTPRDAALYEALHAPLFNVASSLCPDMNTTAVIPQSYARLAFRIYIMKNRGVLDDCIQTETGLIYTFLKGKDDSFIAVLRPVSKRNDFVEKSYDGDTRSPKCWVWALLVGVLHLSNPKALRIYKYQFTPTSEFTKKPVKGQEAQMSGILDCLSNHFKNAYSQTTAIMISRFTHAPVFNEDEDWARSTPRLIFDLSIPVLSISSSCIAFSDRNSAPDSILNRDSSPTESLNATPLEQDVETPASISTPSSNLLKQEPVAQGSLPDNRVSPPYSDDNDGFPTPKLDRVSWFTAKARTLFPIMNNPLKTPQYPAREFIRPTSLVETKPATAASVPNQRIFSEFIIMRALVTEIQGLPTELVETLKPNMKRPLTDGHFKVIFAHPDHEDSRVVSLFKSIEPGNLSARLNELALLVKFRGVKGFSQIVSTVLDSQRQLVGFTLKRHAATFKEVLHHGDISPQIKLGMTYRLARVLLELHKQSVAHRDLSEVNLMIDVALHRQIQSSMTTFHRPRKSQKTNETTILTRLEGHLEDLIPEDPIVIDFGKSASLSSDYTKLFKDVTGSLPPYVSAPEYLPKLRLDTPDEGFRLYRSIVTLPGPKRASPSDEIFDGLKEDVYGFGIIMFRVITGTMPWGGIQERDLVRLREIVSSETEQQRYLHHDLPSSPYWRKLLLKTLHPDPETRWTMAQVVTYFELYPNALFRELFN